MVASTPTSTPTAPAKKPSVVKSIPDIPTMPSPRPTYNTASSHGEIAERNSVEIEENVRLAAKKFEVLQGNIQDLIVALKAQHQSIKTLDEDRLKTAKQLEVLVSESPVAPVVASSKTNMEARASAAPVSDDDEDTLTVSTYKTTVAAVKKTYLELHKNQYDLVLTQAKNFDTDVLQYAEQWLEVISSRVSSNLVEFKKLCENLEHYSKKVAKLKEKEKPNSAKPSVKLERNDTKLRGARESHDNMGENLYKLMEEVTVRAWKDLLPLLMKSIHLDLKQAEEERHVIWDDLQVVVEALEAISTQHNVTADGRLARLKHDHIDVLYTGTHSSHRTTTKPAAPAPSSTSTAARPTTIESVEQSGEGDSAPGGSSDSM